MDDFDIEQYVSDGLRASKLDDEIGPEAASLLATCLGGTPLGDALTNVRRRAA